MSNCILHLDNQCKFLVRNSRVLSIWDSTTLKRLRTTNMKSDNSYGSSYTAISLDKKRVAIANGSVLYIWNTYNGEIKFVSDINERIDEMIYCDGAQTLVLRTSYGGYYSDLSLYLVCNPPKHPLRYEKFAKGRIAALTQVNGKQFTCAFGPSVYLYDISKFNTQDTSTEKSEALGSEVKVERIQYLGQPSVFSVSKLCVLHGAAEDDISIISETDHFQVVLWDKKANSTTTLGMYLQAEPLKFVQLDRNTLAVNFLTKGVELWDISSKKEKRVKKCYKSVEGVDIVKAEEGVLMVLEVKGRKRVRFIVGGKKSLSFSVYIGDNDSLSKFWY